MAIRRGEILPRLAWLFVLALGVFQLSAASDSVGGPDITARCAVLMDAETGTVLWSRNDTRSSYPASTTKIMTALLLIEHCKPDDVITAPQGVEQIPASSLHLKVGEKVTVHDMLYALLLRSANDGCVSVATHISGSVPAFAQLMNERARQLGCKNTHFDNPHGLNDNEHTTCAYDLALIAREAMRHPEFREVVSQIRHKIARSMNQKDVVMVNKDKLLRRDHTFDGIKTGWTVPAGHCFVGSTVRDGYRLISVVLDSKNWEDDEEALVKWGFRNFTQVPLTASLLPQQKLDIAGGGLAEVTPHYPAYTIVAKSDAGNITCRFEPASGKKLPSSVNVGDYVGDYVAGAGNYSNRIPAYVGRITGRPVAGVAKARGVAWTTGIIAVGLGASAWFFRGKARRVRSYGLS